MVARPAEATADQETKFGRRIALISVTLGMALASAKIWVGLAGGSASVTSDGFETASDVFSSAIVYAGLWLASKPPDAEHPYGHGRYETLAGLAVGAILLLTGAGIFTNSFLRISEAGNVQSFTLYPLFAAAILKSGLAWTKFHVGQKIGSTAVQADAWHDVTDLLSTAVAFVSIGLALIDPARFRFADRIGGMLIGLIIFFLSIQVVRRVVDQLLDTMPETTKVAEIREAALSVPGALGIEKCFARRTGLKYHVDLHLEVNPAMTVRESHDIAASVKHAIRHNLSWVADVLVHVEPAAAPFSNRPSHGKQRHRSTTF